MGRWGRGFEVGINKEIDRQFRETLHASEILARECGTRHALGERADLCGYCEKWKLEQEKPEEGEPCRP